MAVYLSTQPVFGVAAAEFQDWAGAVYRGIEEVGLEVTADSGQVAPEDVTNIPLTNGAYSWASNKIYAFADELQDEAPVFVKLELGIFQTNNIDYPCRRVTVGVETDGTGGFVGDTVSHTAAVSLYSSGAWGSLNPLAPSFYCFNDDAGFLGAVSGVAAGGRNAATDTISTFFVVRTNDDSGQATDEGVTLLVGNYGQGTAPGEASITRPFTGQYLDFTTGPGPLCPDMFPRVGGDAPVVSGTDVIEPQRCYIQTGRGVKPIFALMSMWTNYPATGGEFLCANGSISERNYVALGWQHGNRVHSGYSMTKFQMAMLFE